MSRDIVPISGPEWNETGPAKRESRRILAGSARMTPDRESMDLVDYAVSAGNLVGFPGKLVLWEGLLAPCLDSRGCPQTIRLD
jgi:hypothetical protein